MSVPSSETSDAKGRDAVRLKRLAKLGVQDITRDGQRTLVLSGELDLASAWLLDCPLLRICTDEATAFTLDLSALTFIDSAGLRAILAAKGLCVMHDCEFMLIPGPAAVQRVFEVSGLLDHLPFPTWRGGGAVNGRGEPARGASPPL